MTPLAVDNRRLAAISIGTILFLISLSLYLQLWRHPKWRHVRPFLSGLFLLILYGPPSCFQRSAIYLIFTVSLSANIDGVLEISENAHQRQIRFLVMLSQIGAIGAIVTDTCSVTLPLAATIAISSFAMLHIVTLTFSMTAYIAMVDLVASLVFVVAIDVPDAALIASTVSVCGTPNLLAIAYRRRGTDARRTVTVTTAAVNMFKELESSTPKAVNELPMVSIRDLSTFGGDNPTPLPPRRLTATGHHHTASTELRINPKNAADIQSDDSNV